MKIHLQHIPANDSLHLEGEEDPAFLDLKDINAEALSPLHYVLDIGTSDGGVFATGSLRCRVRLRCVACLETFDHDLVIDPFGLQKDHDGLELIDLTPEIREDIHLALPAYPRCDAGGEKTCPAHFSQAPARDSAPPAGNTAWGALDKLKNKD